MLKTQEIHTKVKSGYRSTLTCDNGGYCLGNKSGFSQLLCSLIHPNGLEAVTEVTNRARADKWYVLDDRHYCRYCMRPWEVLKNKCPIDTT